VTPTRVGHEGVPLICRRCKWESRVPAAAQVGGAAASRRAQICDFRATARPGRSGPVHCRTAALLHCCSGPLPLLQTSWSCARLRLPQRVPVRARALATVPIVRTLHSCALGCANSFVQVFKRDFIEHDQQQLENILACTTTKTHARVYPHTHTRTHSRTHMHAQQSCMSAHTHVHTCMHTYTRIHTHTHTHARARLGTYV
jgi:hypothetical protein